jgi:predicted  nucleic acid-binding Zn-ribbon protein
MTNNNDRINEAIAILQMQNMEDCAQAIDNLRNELERVKGIASRRLDKINALQLEIAQIEDDPRRLEDSDDDEIELGREPRSHLENEIADLRASAFRSADAAQYIINYCRGR